MIMKMTMTIKMIIKNDNDNDNVKNKQYNLGYQDSLLLLLLFYEETFKHLKHK